ncbi:MAG TPA: biotin/lipoyl-binding protein, partial [Rhizomicrobium sp.]|nr:biotin/lipoyl-binding protein [Rhizomicrobium sp.]
MNLQISPLHTPPLRDDGRGESPSGRGRSIAIGVAALALVLGGWWYFNHEKAPVARRNLAAPVHVATVGTGNMAVVEHTIGTVMANSTVQINARIQGQMTKAYFKEGQMVKAGDILFQIDPRPYQATYDNALASLATAKAKADRYSRLSAQNAIAGQQFDDGVNDAVSGNLKK